MRVFSLYLSAALLGLMLPAQAQLAPRAAVRPDLGRLDAYIEQGVNLWDVAAGHVLVEEAGGVMEIEEKKDGSLRICASSGLIDFPMK